jgi:DNA-binding response OmpR family regulator
MTETLHQQIPNILIVDDTPANLLLLVGMLSRRGYRTRTVVSGQLALQAAQSETPDLILLDINMPQMDGYEVCEVFKADAALKEIPVIFISALDQTISKVRAFRAGGVDYVTKPFEFEEVYARVETHLKIRTQQRQLNDHNENLQQMVAERTRELSQAYCRLRALARLKNDFLRMISHEIRTPANGLLGIGNLVLELCPASEDRDLYAMLLEQSTLRLSNLIEDATMITNMEKLTLESGQAFSLPDLLREVRDALPDILISLEPSPGLEAFLLKGCHPLLKRALESLVLLATHFSRDRHSCRIMAVIDGPVLRVRLALDALSLSSDQLAVFFELESCVRSVSTAESLGLAPVVAHQIIGAFGGAVSLVRASGDSGYLEVILRKEQP